MATDPNNVRSAGAIGKLVNSPHRLGWRLGLGKYLDSKVQGPLNVRSDKGGLSIDLRPAKHREHLSCNACAMVLADDSIAAIDAGKL